MIRIMLVDDHPMLRQGVAQLIEMEPDLSVMALASNGAEAIDLAAKNDLDLILLDLNMKGMSGLDTLTALKKKEFKGKVVIFTVSDDENHVITALRSGADGYLLKDSEPEELLRAIKQAASGQQVFSPQLTRVLASALVGSAPESSNMLSQLTHREVEILKKVSTGKSNKEIGRDLNIADSTVKVHMKNLLKKLGLKSRVEAALWAVENKIS